MGCVGEGFWQATQLFAVGKKIQESYNYPSTKTLDSFLFLKYDKCYQQITVQKYIISHSDQEQLKMMRNQQTQCSLQLTIFQWKVGGANAGGWEKGNSKVVFLPSYIKEVFLCFDCFEPLATLPTRLCLHSPASVPASLGKHVGFFTSQPYYQVSVLHLHGGPSGHLKKEQAEILKEFEVLLRFDSSES